MPNRTTELGPTTESNTEAGLVDKAAQHHGVIGVPDTGVERNQARVGRIRDRPHFNAKSGP